MLIKTRGQIRQLFFSTEVEAAAAAEGVSGWIARLAAPGMQAELALGVARLAQASPSLSPEVLRAGHLSPDKTPAPVGRGLPGGDGLVDESSGTDAGLHGSPDAQGKAGARRNRPGRLQRCRLCIWRLKLEVLLFGVLLPLGMVVYWLQARTARPPNH